VAQRELDNQAARGEISRKTLGHAEPVGCRVACANYSNARLGEDINRPAHIEN
jgi:hypothetical protein